MCTLFQVSRSGYYAWRDRPPSARAVRRAERLAHIQAIFARSRGRYGSPKITATLRQAGERIAQKTVARLMQAAGLRSRVVKKYKATTNSRHTHPVAENRLNQQFTAERPHQVWMTDITYLATDEGWLYLASVEDLYSRQIVGWAMGERMTQDLVIQALDQAVARYQPPEQVLHHSDRGSQYAAADYQARLARYHMVGSMSRKGNCYDNACIESWHSLLKKELIYLERWPTRQAVQQAVFEYIEIWYNRQRIHSALGYRTPHAALTAALDALPSRGEPA